MGRREDLGGRRFGWLTVERYTSVRPPNSKQAHWLCVCDCGEKTIVGAAHLKTGNTKSCGCLVHSGLPRKHGLSKSRIYRTYGAMLQRCYNEKNPRYWSYGGRGITVAPEWHDFRAFFADMGDPPTGHWLDRIDNDGPYCKENCRWATRKEQMNNMRTNRRVTLEGETKTLSQWAELLGISFGAALYRLERGTLTAP